MAWLGNAVLVYGVLMLLGGIFGFAKARSAPSLIAGLASGIVLIVCGLISVHHPRIGFGGATLIAAVLEITFVRRFQKTKKPMPSLALAGVSFIMFMLLVIGHFVAH